MYSGRWRHSIGKMRYLVAVLFICGAVGIGGTPMSQNHDLLTKIGFMRVRSPNSHNRKRLAVESRHHTRSDDSQMFVIKLPANPHYYSHNQPMEIPNNNNIPVGFKSNGKPAKVYHWNIPLIKRVVSKKYKAHLKHGGHRGNIGDFPEKWNEVLDKEMEERDHHHRVALKPAYYVPTKAKKGSFMKYFSGNGKPHSFYVIDKSKKAHFHRLLP